MREAACRGPRERHSPGPNLALNGPAGQGPVVVFCEWEGNRRFGVMCHSFHGISTWLEKDMSSPHTCIHEDYGGFTITC